jgi:hypothetical protein
MALDQKDSSPTIDVSGPEEAMHEALSIDDEIRRKTDCETFGCLQGQEKTCKVKESLAGHALLVDPVLEKRCDYMTSIRYSYCTCPTRIEIYRKYGI